MSSVGLFKMDDSNRFRALDALLPDGSAVVVTFPDSVSCNLRIGVNIPVEELAKIDSYPWDLKTFNENKQRYLGNSLEKYGIDRELPYFDLGMFARWTAKSSAESRTRAEWLQRGKTAPSWRQTKAERDASKRRGQPYLDKLKVWDDRLLTINDEVERIAHSATRALEGLKECDSLGLETETTMKALEDAIFDYFRIAQSARVAEFKGRRAYDILSQVSYTDIGNDPDLRKLDDEYDRYKSIENIFYENRAKLAAEVSKMADEVNRLVRVSTAKLAAVRHNAMRTDGRSTP